MVACSVSISDERTASAVRALLEVLDIGSGYGSGYGSENGSILITDSPDADLSSYARAVLLTDSDDEADVSAGVTVVHLPLDYAVLADVLTGLASESGVLSADDKKEAEEQSIPEINNGEIKWRDMTVHLTEREFRLFEYLRSANGRIVSRGELMNAVWNEPDSDTNVADVYISYLRKKLVPVFGQGVLVSVRGQGYLLSLPM